MKKLLIGSLVALASVALVTAAFACEKEKKLAAAGGDAHKGCAHAAKADGAGCAHGAKGAEGAKAELAAYKDSAAGCPFHSKATEAQREALQKGEQVTLVGHVLCGACDLKTAKSCKSVFRTEGGKMFAIIGNDAFEKLAAETRHGEKKVEVVGKTAQEGEESIVLLEEFKILS